MYARVKKSGKYQYLQIVKSRREGKKVTQQVIATIGRMDRLSTSGEVESLVRSLAKFSDKALLILSGQSDPSAVTRKIGPALVFERLWAELGIQQVIRQRLGKRKFSFAVERAIFVTVLHRLMVSGSDRSCDRWKRDYVIEGAEELNLHQLYRTMSLLGEPLDDQEDATPFSPRCFKDLIEEDLHFARRDLLTRSTLKGTVAIRWVNEGTPRIIARI